MGAKTYDLGPVLMVPKGNWDATVAYERLNLVRHNGTAWLCTAPINTTSLNEEPSLQATNWEILVQDQSSVTSVNGMRGDVTIDESDYVHKSGTETITGDKTFAGALKAMTPNEDDESDNVATTEWVKNTTLTNAIGGNNLFDIKWADHRLNDMSWLRSDTFSWHNGEVYSAAYQELLNEYTNVDSVVKPVWGKPFVNPQMTSDSQDGWVASAKTGTTPYLAFNKDWSTGEQAYYTGGSQPTGWLQLQCPKAYKLLSVKIKNEVATPANFKNATIEGSNDGINFDTLYTITNWPNTAGYEQKITINANTVYKYFRLNVSETWSGSFSLQEVEFTFSEKLFEYKETPKKYRITTPDSIPAIQSIFEDTGVAWFYILDTTNTRFKLPRTKFGFTGLRSGVGEFVEAGLPNITGSINRASRDTVTSPLAINLGRSASAGALYNTVDLNSKISFNATGSSSGSNLQFDASKSDSIYGNSSTVQPPATEMYLYHYVGNFNKDAILANIGVTQQSINSTSFLNTPVGTIIWSMANAVPAGYLVCNGQAVGRLAYPELFSAIGTTYGEGDGDSTFNLPNLIGKFVEGGATAGIEHEAGLPDIEGTWQPEAGLVLSNTGVRTGAFTLASASASYRIGGTTGGGNAKLNFKASDSNSIYGNSNTVQPPSLTAMPCIKAFDAVVNDGTVDVNELIHEVPARVYNTREVLTTSGTWTAPMTGWYKVTCIGGGGGGGQTPSTTNTSAPIAVGNQKGGGAGGDTLFGTLLTGVGGSGGGAGGENTSGGSGGTAVPTTGFFFLTKNSVHNVVIGAGGLEGASTTVNGAGASGGTGSTVRWQPGQGAKNGSLGRITGPYLNTLYLSVAAESPSNGTGYGGGGYALGHRTGSGSTATSFMPLARGAENAPDAPTDVATFPWGHGGNGGDGAIILEYFNPATPTN